MEPPLNYLEKDALFSAIDVNKTGQISRNEYFQVILKDEYQAMKQESLKKYQSEFNLINKSLSDRGTKSLEGIL
jgi:Ca2+-binding EF-hand superfamily protein